MKISKQKVEQIMAEKGLTAAEVAKRSGVSRQNFSTIKLRGTCEPATAGKIARGLGVNVSDVLEVD
jgi:hypothetical protein